MEQNQEFIPALKVDLKALKKLQKNQRTKKNSLPIELYKEKRIAVMDQAEHVEMDADDYNDMVSEMLDLLEADYTEGIFDTEEYEDEKETLEALIFQSKKPIDGVKGFFNSGIEYDPKKMIKETRVSNPTSMINALNQRGFSFLMRKTGESTEIISGHRKIHYTHSSNFPARKLFLFIHVRKDVEKWLAKRGDYVLPPLHDVTRYNLDYDDSIGEICGTDLNHAYWRIAYLLGLISESTYNHGLDPECKALRLATISILGREKSYKQYQNGKPVRRVILQKADPKQQGIFKLVRYTCFQWMNDLSLMLGDDFDAYETDCIYYRKTEANVKMVKDYFTKRNLKFKQLEFSKKRKKRNN